MTFTGNTNMNNTTKTHMKSRTARTMQLLAVTAMITGLAACGGGGGGGGASADPTIKIGMPVAQAIDAGNQPLTLTLQDLVQPTITLIN
jgi:hypothetical protein